jgi:hypothetical protein
VTYQTPLNRKTEAKMWVGCAWFSLPTCAIKATPLAKNLENKRYHFQNQSSPQQ